MNQQKKVSVIVPCYNVEPFIERCFKSLVNQTIGLDNIELIFVDDASTDGTWTKLLQFEALYPDYVLAIHNDVNRRQGYCRNIALDYASAKYVSYVDSDDWLELEFFEIMLKAAEEYDADIASCQAMRDYGNGKIIKLRVREPKETMFYDLSNNLAARKDMLLFDRLGTVAWGKLIRRKFLIDNSIFFPEGIIYEDIPWSAICYVHLCKAIVLKDYLYHYFVNFDSTVLCNKQTNYRDMFEANYIKWEQFQLRGAFEVMPKEVEYDFLMTYYFGILKLFGKREGDIPMDAFMELQQFILRNMPEYNNNPYVQTCLKEDVKVLLGFIDKRINDIQLKEIHSYIQKLNI